MKTHSNYAMVSMIFSLLAAGCGDSGRSGSSGSSLVDRHDCTSEVMSRQDVVVAGCPDTSCVRQEVKKLMDKCAAKKGY
jgi:hypothetical protein